MSIRIDKITSGRFGNKILQYNCLIQLSKIHNVSCSFVQNNEITKFFKNVVPFIPSKNWAKLTPKNEINSVPTTNLRIISPCQIKERTPTGMECVDSNQRTFSSSQL